MAPALTIPARRVVVTGIGLICGIGNTAPAVWDSLMAGASGMAEITAYELEGHSVRFAAEVKNFDPHVFVEKKEARKMGRFIHFAMAAAAEAMAHSGLQVTPENAEMIGVDVGSGIGGFDIIEREHTNLMNGGPRKVSPFFIPATIVNLAAGHVSIKYGAKGPNQATATACTTSAHTIGDAYRIIQRGDADAMIAGGAEAAITPLSVSGFANMKALSTRNEEPTRASILILEELDFALARGAKILGEVVGYGMSSDAFHMTGMAPEGEGCARSMRNALKSAGLQPEEIDYVNAHATSTPLGDAMESKGMETIFGEHALSHKLLVSSTKSMTGHLLGGAGGLEAGITLMAMQKSIVPPTVNLDNVDPECRLNYVPHTPVHKEVRYALSNSFGFGGTNGSLIFKRWDGE